MESQINWRLNRQIELDGNLGKTPGVIVLPNESENNKKAEISQKSLFDPNNPTTPILILSNQSRNYTPPEEVKKSTENKPLVMTKASISDQYLYEIPVWYDQNSELYRSVHQPQLIENLKHHDMRIQLLVGSGEIFSDWKNFIALRGQIQKILEQLLTSEMKFCQNANVEHHFWKLLYYNIIELMKKKMAEEPVADNKIYYKLKLIEIIDSGNEYFEQILKGLEINHHFFLDNYLGNKAGGEIFCLI